jgi:hypothetical protein
MTTQTIPEYLEEERQKIAETQLRTVKEAARIEPLQHGHHRKTKQPKLELVPLVKAAPKREKKEKDRRGRSQEAARCGKATKIRRRA